MALHRVPGAPNYQADDSGLAEIAASSKVAAETMRAAQRLATAAKITDLRGRYEVEADKVSIGWDRRPRAGAVVTQAKTGHRSGQSYLASVVLRAQIRG